MCLQGSLRGSSFPSQGKVLQRCFPCSPLRVASSTVWNGFVKLRIKHKSGCSSLLCYGTENHADMTSPDPLSCLHCSHQELADEQLSPHRFPAVCLLFPTKSHTRCSPSLRGTIPDIQTHPSNLQTSAKSFPTHEAEGTRWIRGAPSWSAIWKQECDQTEGLPINCLSGGNETCEQLGETAPLCLNPADLS